jgi:hypothetical protein
VNPILIGTDDGSVDDAELERLLAEQNFVRLQWKTCADFSKITAITS